MSQVKSPLRYPGANQKRSTKFFLTFRSIFTNIENLLLEVVQFVLQ
jgi:hypothetical protein